MLPQLSDLQPGEGEGKGRGGVTNKGGMGIADEWGEGGEGLGRGKNK